MGEAIAGIVIAAVFAGIVVAPIIGGYLGLKHGQQRKLEARKRQMKTALLTGNVDELLLRQSVAELRDEGLL